MKSKLFILILMMASCALIAQETGHLLGQKVTINFKESSVDDVLKALENEIEGMVFMYSPSSLDLKRKVSVSFIQKSLKEVLETIFKGANIEFQEKKNKLLLKPGKYKPKGGQNGAVKAEVKQDKQEKGSSPRRRKVRVTKPPTNDAVINPEEQQVKKVSAKNDRVEPALEIPRVAVQKEETPKEERSELATISNNQKIHVQQLPKLRYQGPIRIEQDSSFVSDKRFKKLLAKAKREEERADENKKLRIYGSAYTGYTRVNDRGGIQIGGSLVWLKNKRWGFGLSGYAVQSSVTDDPILLDKYRLAAGYGGLLVEYTLNPTDRIHFSFPLMVGGGGIAYNRRNDVGLDPDDAITEASKAFFVVESGAMVEANVIKYLRVGLGISYRLTSSTLLNYINDPSEISSKTGLTGLNFGLSLKFGLF